MCSSLGLVGVNVATGFVRVGSRRGMELRGVLRSRAESKPESESDPLPDVAEGVFEWRRGFLLA